MRFRVLGELEVSRRGTPLAVPAGKLRVLLATLLLRANQTVPLDVLVDRLWDHSAPRRARGSVPTYVMRLRQALGDDTKAPALVQTRPAGYLISIERHELDLFQFRDLVDRATGLPPAEAAATLREALSLWRGAALAGVPSEALHQQEVPPLVEERLRALERRIEFDLLLGQRDDLVAELSTLTREYPLRERFWGQLMLALVRSGRRAEALERYREIRDLLIEELGIDPGPELVRLHQAILRGDAQEPAALPSPVWTVPRQLPADVMSFAGRDAELSILDGQLRTATVICAIHGTAGVGKTALAVHWSHRVSHQFPDGQLYINLRGFDPDRPPVDPGEALSQFLRAFGVEQAQIPQDLEERSALFRSAVAGRRMLVLLDNVSTADQVRPLLPGTASCLVLVTSRSQLTGLVAVDDARALPLHVLTPAESLALLENLLGRERIAAEPDAAEALARRCGHLPLAIRVAAGKLVMRPAQPIADAVTELHDDVRLGALEVEGDRRAAVRAAFDMSYLALKPEEQRLFRRLGLVAGPDLTAPVAAALGDLSKSDTTVLLDQLRSLNLVDCPTHDRFRLHDLLRSYTRDRCISDESVVDIRAAVTRLYDWYLASARAAVQLVHPASQMLYDAPDNGAPFAERTAAWAWLEAERTNLICAIEDAAERDMPDMVLRLIDALRGFFVARAYFDGDWQTVTRTGLRAAERLGDDRARAAMHLNLAIAHYGLAELRLYLEHSTEALEYARRANWTRATAKALTYLGQGNHELGYPDQALIFLAEARELDISRADLSYIDVILGHTHLEMGNLPEALHHFDETLSIGRELASLPDQSLAHNGLGLVHTALGDPDRASASFTTGLSISREFGSRDREATCLSGLAELAHRAGRDDEARDLLTEALAVSATAGYRHTDVHVHNAAGRIHAALGDTQAATTHHERALRVSRRVGYRFYETEALLGLAEVQRQKGNPAQARVFAVQALGAAADAGYRLLTHTARTTLAHLNAAPH